MKEPSLTEQGDSTNTFEQRLEEKTRLLENKDATLEALAEELEEKAGSLSKEQLHIWAGFLKQLSKTETSDEVDKLVADLEKGNFDKFIEP